MSGTLKHLRVTPVHPGPGKESFIELALLPEDRKSARLDVYVITEDEATLLAEQALVAVRIIRKTRDDRRVTRA